MMRVRSLAALTMLVLARHVSAQDHPQVTESTVAALWQTATADIEQLSLLSSATGELGGAKTLRAVLRTLGDKQRPTLVRIAALVAIIPYMKPADVCGSRLLDTLRRSSNFGCWVDHPSYRAASSIEPILRDSIRAALRLAASEPGALGRTAEYLSSDWSGPEKWNETRANWCTRAGKAFGAALRMNSFPLVSDELRELASCTASGPAALVLAWRAVAADSLVVHQLLGISASVRDRRLYDVLFAVARDPSRPVPVRVAAVDAVAPLLHPALYWFRSRRRSDDSSQSCSGWGFFSHEAVQEEGAEPLGAASRRAGVAELLRLANEDVPSAVSNAARTVARCAQSLLDTRSPES